VTLLLGIDLGTTGCKAVVYDEQGACLGEGYLEYGLITLSPSMIEQDPHAWWQLTCQAIHQALEAAHADREAVRAMAVSSQGISFVVLDGTGQPLGNAINWLDTRAVDESALILERYPAETVFAITGKRAAPAYVLPKLLWLRSNRPEVWRQARRVLLGHDYLVYRLCGRCVTDHSLAGGTLLYDLRVSDWCAELLNAFDIPPGILPELCWSGTPVGTLCPEVAAELGLRQDTVVVVGGQDQKCAALGAGIEDGTATVSLGTAAAITRVMDQPRTDPHMRVPTFSFVQPGRWVLEGVIGTAAGSLRWFRDVLGGGTSYDQLVEEAGRVTPGADGVVFYPHLSGAGSPHWHNAARGTFHGMSLATTRAHLTRALLEGVAFQIRENLAITQELAGPVRQAIVFGGGAKSDLWRQIIGDVANLSVAWTPHVETASLGAAMLAGYGEGIFGSLAEARRVMVQVLPPRQPEPQNTPVYEQKYQHYRRMEEHLLCL
jgi:xylulokinase